MAPNPFDAAAARRADVPEFFLVDPEQLQPPVQLVVRPEETIDTQYISHVRFYDGSIAYSFKCVPGCVIRLPASVFALQNMTVAMPLFNLTCSMSFVTEPGFSGRLVYRPEQARQQVFYNAHELCDRAETLYRALTLHAELGGVSDWGDVGTIDEYRQLTETFAQLPALHFERFNSAWLAPADLDFWARELDLYPLHLMADRLVISEASPLF